MNIDQNEIDRIVTRPAETRDLEIKSWLDPRMPQGKAKLLTALFALRNFNGGNLLIGFDDKTQHPVAAQPADVVDAYTNDDIQALVSKYASEAFDISVGFGNRDGYCYPVVSVDAGVRTPVAMKVPFIWNGQTLIRKGVVFFRTLYANGIVSSAEAQPSDWPEILQICMDNRESDIGRFIRRHLAGLDLVEIMHNVRLEPHPTLVDQAFTWLAEGKAKWQSAVNRWPLEPYPGTRPDIHNFLKAGGWEIALVIAPPILGLVADNAFYQTVATSIPSHSASPIWSGSRSSKDWNRHRQIANGWEALVVLIQMGVWDTLEFQRWEPTGRFYLRRLHEDDASAMVRGTGLRVTLDPGLVASLVAEAIITGLGIAKALGGSEESTTLTFAFRWTGLRGRRLDFWSSRYRYRTGGQQCHDEEEEVAVTVPLTTAPSAVSPFVMTATRSLFAKFDGFSMSMDLIERSVQRVFHNEI